MRCTAVVTEAWPPGAGASGQGICLTVNDLTSLGLPFAWADRRVSSDADMEVCQRLATLTWASVAASGVREGANPAAEKPRVVRRGVLMEDGSGTDAVVVRREVE